DGEVIGGDAVRAEQHEVFKLAVRELDAAHNSIVECGDATLGHAEADGCRLARGAARSRIRRRDDAAAAVVHGGLGGLRCTLSAMLQIFLGAEAGISMASVD